jgi:glycosyltransferase involved in cell wall biosynthesis
MTPQLSICIPTFNRADLLESALDSLSPQIAEVGTEVELIVSDNCSTDHTAQVVESAARRCPVRYHRNEENVGVIDNFLGTAQNLARGEFCWMMGDDELVRPGAVRAVLKAIKMHPDLDYFYVNYSMHSFEQREGRQVTVDDFKTWTRTGNENLIERTVNRWEELVAEDFNAITPVYCSVFRRTAWLRGAASLKSSELFSCLDQTYPTAVVLCKTMVGKRAWSSGYPWIIMCGKESWARFIPVVVLLRFHELLDMYLEYGVEARLVNRHRRRMLEEATDPLAKVLSGETPPLLEDFSVTRFIFKYCHYPELWRSLFRAAGNVPQSRIVQSSFPLAAFTVTAKGILRCRNWFKVRTSLNL